VYNNHAVAKADYEGEAVDLSKVKVDYEGEEICKTSAYLKQAVSEKPKLTMKERKSNVHDYLKHAMKK
jgi:ligand-binding sensor protein